MRAVLSKLKVTFEKPGNYIVRQHQSNKKIFFLSNGLVSVFKSFNRFDCCEVLHTDVYEHGKMFGEVSCVLNCKADFSALCKNYCKVGALVKEDYETILFDFPYLNHTMWKQIKGHEKENPIQSFFMHYYKNIYYLENL